MKKGINYWSFPPDMGLPGRLALARDAGFDGIELAVMDHGPVNLDSTEAELKEVAKRVADHGLGIPSLASGLYWANSPTSDDEATREKARHIATRQIEAAAALGADTVLFIPGMVNAAFIPDSPVVSYDVVWKRAIETLQALVPVAEKNQVHVGVEVVWNKFLLSPIEMNVFLDEVGSDCVGLYMDVGNVIPFGYPEQWIRICGSRLKKVHFKDFKMGAGNVEMRGFCDLLDGSVNWPEVMAALQEVGYDDYCTAEMIPHYAHHPEQRIHNTSASMDRILGRAV